MGTGGEGLSTLESSRPPSRFGSKGAKIFGFFWTIGKLGFLKNVVKMGNLALFLKKIEIFSLSFKVFFLPPLPS